MSQIDQAFIQAYTAEVTSAPSTMRSTGSRVAHAQPHLQTRTIDPQTANLDAEQTVRAPHFDLPRSSDPQAETAALQQAAVGTMQGSPGVDSTSGVRQPLSSFTTAEPATANTFKPVFEVDAFRWPQVTSDMLEQHAPLLIPIVEQLISMSEAGRSMVAIAGSRHRVGATSVLLCLARMLASVEKEVAIVDADFSWHSLATDLGLDIETGWEDVLSGQLPLAEGVIHSLDDNVSLLPLAGRAPLSVDLLSGIQTSISAGVLRYHYDLVLFDIGDAGRQPQWSAAQKLMEQCRIDSSIIVADAAHTSPSAGENIEPLMALLGSTCLGVIGNSVS